jgi:hypothetical protein
LGAEAKSRSEAYKLAKLKKVKLKGNLLHQLSTFEFNVSDGKKTSWDKTVRQAWLSAVYDQMRAQFPHDKIISALDTLFNPSKFPEKPSTTYGKQALEDLIAHHGVTRGGQPAVIDGDRARQDWAPFLFGLQQARFALRSENTEPNTTDKERGEVKSKRHGKDEKRDVKAKDKDKEQNATDVKETRVTMADVLCRVLANDFICKTCPDIVKLAQFALVLSVAQCRASLASPTSSCRSPPFAVRWAMIF